MKAIINLSARQPVLPEFPIYGICILESRHAHGFEMAPSRYDFSEIMLILDGKGWVVNRKVRHPVKKGDLVTVATGEAYYYEDSKGEPLAMLCLCVAPTMELAPFFEPVLPKRFTVIRSLPLSREINPHLRAILYEQSRNTVANAPMVVAHTLLILGKLSRRRESSPYEEDRELSDKEVQLLARVRDYIEKLETTFHDNETIRAAADRLGMSPRSFTDYFRRVAGMPRHQYIQKLRLRQARFLLAETQESITSVAFACGFEDLSTFFRAFRTEEKITPTQWRKNHQAGDDSGA